MLDLSIIILNYKSTQKTLACLRSIFASDPGGIICEVIVVDNGSGDGIEAALDVFKDKIRFIQTGANLGMGKGNNAGIAQAQGEYILILNADTTVRPDAISKLYRHIKADETIGIIGPKVLYPDGSLQDTCMRFPKIYTPFLRRTFLGRIFPRHVDNFLMKDFDRSTIKDVDWMMGSCLLMSKNTIEKIGGAFDGRFFMYFEDTDLCRRSWKAGLRVVFYPDADIIHNHGRGSAEGAWFLAPFRNRLAREHIKSWLKYFYKWGLKNF